ncbi:uncharacterized protein LOC120680243 isoform X3 [Panicum virgatum]|uniref:uncharacterized protein LOC120680243 isoform X3 n=1 Tax=Panicum virgatum TaxID=38727 RepID=UPI0019D62F93|nr:uncharacterized protein LOC120680243 isoform X3 [Panicum virgatum]
MAGSEEVNMWDFLSVGDTHHAAGGDFVSSTNANSTYGAGQAPTPRPITEPPPPAPILGGFPPPTPGGYGHLPPPPVYAGLHSAPHPDTGFDLNASSSAVGGSPASMGYGRHQYPWAPQAGWAGSSQQYPPPVLPGRGAHDEGALCGQKGRGRGRCGRVHCSGAAPPSPSRGSSRGRSQTRNTLTIGSSSNSGTGDDGDNDDDGDDSDSMSDNYSSRWPDEVNRLKRGFPTWTAKLYDMFKECTIDWSKMKVTGGYGTSDSDGSSPTTTSGSRKRASSGGTSSTAESPSKKNKRPKAPSAKKEKLKVRSLLQSMFLEMKKPAEAAKQVLDQAHELKKAKEKEKADALKYCLDLAVQSGISRTSDEFFFLSKLFKSEHWRGVFCYLQTPDERLAWIYKAFADPTMHAE